MTIIQTDRQVGILDTRLLADTNVLQIGVGRGKTAAELLASSGVGYFTLIDPDTVSPENIWQSSYTHQDVGKLKVDMTADYLKRINPQVSVRTSASVAQKAPHLARQMATADLIKIGIDAPKAQFELADLAQSVGTSAIVCGTTGDNTQWFAAHIFPSGPRLRELLPQAWAGLQAGYTAPAFFPSCRLHAESLNVQVARLALGLIHHQAGSNLPISDIGKAFTLSPLVIGSNHWHEQSNFLTPACFLDHSPI
ncbi:ThiF family adenylyltransferase [Rhizobium rhizogenes]|nr:ThiF family adenylyltransferase [Rhizobium rhizogenes]